MAIVRTLLSVTSRKVEIYDICTSQFVSRRPDAATRTSGAGAKYKRGLYFGPPMLTQR
jgi:hypothetical protein